MDIRRFDKMLAQGLMDPDGETFDPKARLIAMSEAVRAYSRYRKCRRRYGFAVLYQELSSPVDTTVYISGAAIPVGTVVTIDESLPWEESFTVTAIEPANLDDQLVGFPLKVTLNGTPQSRHRAGALISHASPGLRVATGQALYALPFDFIDVDRQSWDIATGSRTWIKQQESFYDGVYRFSELIGGVGYGQSQLFRGMSGFAALPSGSGSSTVVPPGSSGPVFSMLDGYPPKLQVAPAPTVGAVYDLYYYGQCLPEEVPDHDLDALLAKAKSQAYRYHAATFASEGGTWREGEVSESPSAAVDAYVKLAEQAEQEWSQAIAGRPLIASG